MHYRTRGLVIRSENAAKVPAEVSGGLRDWLLQNVSAERALDYGCGRFRYAPYLVRKSRRITLVDSTAQLDRTTKVAGRTTTLRRYAEAKWPTCSIYSTTEFWAGVSERFDFALCANVLSAIPSQRIRARSVQAIRSALTSSGLALFVHQHTNSFFTQLRQDPRATPHLDGWILRSRKGPSYFGVLPRSKMVRLVEANRMRVRDAWVVGQSNYVLASR